MGSEGCGGDRVFPRDEGSARLGTIQLTQRPYWEHVLNQFSLSHITPRNTPLPVGIVLDASMSPKTDLKRKKMDDKPY
jgi:hypothetical protein